MLLPIMLLISITQINFLLTDILHCPVIFPENTNCHCVFDFKIICSTSSADAQITLQVETEDIDVAEIWITCNDNNVNSYKLLPVMDIENYTWMVTHVIIESCPLPSEPFFQLFRQLRIRNVTSVEFKNEAFAVNLTAHHLTKLYGLKKLIIKSTLLTLLTEDLFKDLPNLVFLQLRSNITKLPSNIFNGLRNLVTLVLHLNVTELPSGIFSNQKKMTLLDLDNEQLRNVTKYAFEGATSVKQLIFSSKSMKILQTDIFSMLKGLRMIKLNFNNFSELPPDLFTNNKQITSVEMFIMHSTSTPVRTLPPGLFANLADLKYVKIICDLDTFLYDVINKILRRHAYVQILCGINEMPENIFHNSSLIRKMILNNNELEVVPARFLSKQYDLQYLDLSFNRLKSLPNELFRDTRNLQVLKLAHNQLTNITNECFRFLHNLKELNLNNNHLKTINSNVFFQTKNLIHLQMLNNFSNFGGHDGKETSLLHSEVSFPFQSLQKLEVLQLRNNSLRFFSNDWIGLKSLKKLELRHNCITYLNFSLTLVRSHKLTIDLTHNRIHTINTTGIENLKNLSLNLSVNLNENPLECDCKLFSSIRYVCGNQRVELNITTEKLMCSKPDKLKAVHICDIVGKALICPFNSAICPRGCNCWEDIYSSMLIVNCSNINLTKVPTLPWKGPLTFKTIELHIENNKFHKLPTVFISGYKDVTQIYAAGNNISEIDADNLPVNLTQIDLSHNNLKKFNTNALDFINKNNSIYKISLAGNPWICDCETTPFIQFVQQRRAIITDVREIYCTGRESSKKILDLTINDICPDNDQVMVIALVACISIVGFLTALSVAFYYKYRTEIKVLLYKYRICLCLVNEEALDKDKKYDAFISYSHKDLQFVVEYLIPELENSQMGFKLCVDMRDFIVGEYISDQIINAIDNSRRTLVVLSRNFIESVWAREEFRLAHQAALSEGRIRVIVIIYGDIGDTDSLDLELKAYLKMNIYLKWGDPWFWDKLRYAMPHR